MKAKWLPLILSVFLIYHIVAILLYPNPGSVLYRYLDPVFSAYGNQLGLNTTWQFFSPNPGTFRYLSYDTVIETDDDIDLKSYTFPPQDDSLLQTNQARLFYFTVRMISHPPNIKKFLVPYLCRKHPEATSIALKAVDKRIPSMAKAKIFAAESFRDMHEEADIPEEEFGCDREVVND
jgi:hypothetical protein